MWTVDGRGAAIPALGFGTFKLAPADARRMVEHVLGVGYRHIDTAQGYHNEAEVGAAIRASNVPRDEIFVTTKVAMFAALDTARADGLTRHIGVSNYPSALLERAIEASEAALVTNQVEYHPFLTQRSLLAALRRAGMSLTAYCPLARRCAG